MSRRPLAVIKIGGEILDSPALCRQFAEQICTLHRANTQIVAVHGGGGLIGRNLQIRGIASRFVRGLRVTDEATMAVVEDSLAGTANQQLVRAINTAFAAGSDSSSPNDTARGISGKNAGLLRARPLTEAESHGEDYGLVGQVEQVNRHILDSLLNEGLIPVVAPIGLGADGRSYNINADVAAAALAAALRADQLALLSNVAGVLDASGVLIPSLTAPQAQSLIRSGVITDGMIPKIEQALLAVRAGVGSVHILDGKQPQALSAALNRRKGAGTVVCM